MKYIFFDFDGTIANTQSGTIKALESMAKTLNITDLGEDTYKKFIGPALIASLKKYYPDLPESRYQQAIDAFDDYYNNHGLYDLKLYPQMTDILATLQEEGYQLFISSAKPETLIRKLITHLKLDPYFTGLYGASDDEKTRIDKAEILKYAIESSHAIPDESIIIGDRATDIIGGIKNKIHTLGITYGFGEYKELANAGAESILEDPTEIPSEIRTFD